VQSNVNGCRRFFAMEVEARLVAAGMMELQMEEINETPDTCNLPDTTSWSNEEKKRWLRNLATTIVDNYVLNKDKFNDFVRACENKDIQETFPRTGDFLSFFYCNPTVQHVINNHYHHF
jgi:hypothetical protein